MKWLDDAPRGADCEKPQVAQRKNTRQQGRERGNELGFSFAEKEGWKANSDSEQRTNQNVRGEGAC